MCVFAGVCKGVLSANNWLHACVHAHVHASSDSYWSSRVALPPFIFHDTAPVTLIVVPLMPL